MEQHRGRAALEPSGTRLLGGSRHSQLHSTATTFLPCRTRSRASHCYRPGSPGPKPRELAGAALAGWDGESPWHLGNSIAWNASKGKGWLSAARIVQEDKVGKLGGKLTRLGVLAVLEWQCEGGSTGWAMPLGSGSGLVAKDEKRVDVGAGVGVGVGVALQ